MSESRPLIFKWLWVILSVIMLTYATALIANAQPSPYEPSDFDGLHAEAVWPVPDLSCSAIGSAFGPRVVSNSDDFHEGLDIRGAGGEDVVSVWHGTVHGVRSSSGCGEYVIIRHTMPSGQTIRFHNQEFTRFWTWYCHLQLDSIPSTIVRGATVMPGTVLGKLGDTGRAKSPHLHWELRIGNNNLHFSSRNAGFDPNVNPLVLLTNQGAGGMSACDETDANLTVDVNASGGPLVTAQIEDRDHRHNRWLVTITERGTGAAVATHELDYDRRIGFDSSDKDKLEGDWDKTVPYVQPQGLNTQLSYLEQRLHVPTAAGAWLDGKPELLRAVVQLFNLEGAPIGQVEFDLTNPHPALSASTRRR